MDLILASAEEDILAIPQLYSSLGKRAALEFSLPQSCPLEFMFMRSQNTVGMEQSGNFWLSCDIKEAWTM